MRISGAVVDGSLVGDVVRGVTRLQDVERTTHVPSREFEQGFAAVGGEVHTGRVEDRDERAEGRDEKKRTHCSACTTKSTRFCTSSLGRGPNLGRELQESHAHGRKDQKETHLKRVQRD